MKQHIDKMNLQYKNKDDKHNCKNARNESLSLIHLNKQRLPDGHFHNLQAKNYGPFQFVKKINANSNVIDIPCDWRITFDVSDIHSYHLSEDAVVLLMDSESNSVEDGDSNVGAYFLLKKNLCRFLKVVMSLYFIYSHFLLFVVISLYHFLYCSICHLW